MLPTQTSFILKAPIKVPFIPSKIGSFKLQTTPQISQQQSSFHRREGPWLRPALGDIEGSCDKGDLCGGLGMSRNAEQQEHPVLCRVHLPERMGSRCHLQRGRVPWAACPSGSPSKVGRVPGRVAQASAVSWLGVSVSCSSGVVSEEGRGLLCLAEGPGLFSPALPCRGGTEVTARPHPAVPPCPHPGHAHPQPPSVAKDLL